MSVFLDALRARLGAPTPDHPAFTGAPVDLSELDAIGLGHLWADIEQVRYEPDNPAARLFAYDILRHAAQQGIEPAFDADSALRTVAGIAEHRFAAAIFCLSRMICPVPEAMLAHLRRILGDPVKWREHPYQVVALARPLDETTRQQVVDTLRARYHDAPYRLRELDWLAQLGHASLLALGGESYRHYWPSVEGATGDDAAQVLATEPAYLDFAHDILHEALVRVQAIGSGQVPYVAHGAFATEDSQVLACAVRVAALRDEPWLRGLIGPLLTGVCVAPTAAKTAPSESLSVALGHSIQGVPTPEGVQALRDALAVVRHAGLEKKLARNLKPAERALAARPDLALRVTSSAAPLKRQQALLTTCLEAGYWQGLTLSWAEWRSQLFATPAGEPFARSLVWQVSAGAATRSFMLDPQQKHPAPLAVNGERLQLDDAERISLWHPASASSQERAHYRSEVAARKLRQPIRQVFREHYTLDETEPGCSLQFSGHVLSWRPLIGLARREGWRIDDQLVREFGTLQVHFDAGGQLYPGIGGWGESGALWLRVRRGARWEVLPAAALDPVALSEACRAVDLLVSTSSFALEEPGTEHDPQRQDRLQQLEQRPAGAMLQMRRAVLADAFAAEVDAGRIRIEQRHIVVGEHAVHLATARVTRAGSQADIALAPPTGKLHALPWLPYDEVLLEKTARAIAALLSGAGN